MFHLHYSRMYPLLTKRYFWPTMHADVVHKNAPEEKLRSTDANQIHTIVCVDLIGPIHTSKRGYKYILNCIDHFTSWTEAAPLKTIIAEEVTTVSI